MPKKIMEVNMNITFVTPGMNYGGAERVISLLSNQWVAMGHNVNLLIVGENPTCVYYLDEKIKVRCIGGLKGKPIIAHFNLVRKIKKEIHSFNTDVTVSFMNDTCAYTAMALKGTKIPLFYSERNDPTKVNQRGIDKIYRKIVEKRADGIVFQTNGAKSYYSKKVQKKSKVILNPFNASNLPEYDFENKEKEIVSVGRLQPQKNHALLIDAFSLISDKFKDYTLKIYGDGILREDLQRQINELGLENQVILMGAHQDVLNKINKASLFAFSSDYEGLPNALIEAMCIGIPSVSTDCSPGGARELIENEENGLLVPCNDATALADAMEKVLVNEELARTFSINGKKIADRMESRKIAEKWLEFISKEV